MKEKITAINDLIGMCEQAIAQPAKRKRSANTIKEEPAKESEDKDLEELLRLHAASKE